MNDIGEKSDMSVETIESLRADREELWQEIMDDDWRLEHFMLTTGGSSDESDRLQANLDSKRETLAEMEKRLWELLNAREKETSVQGKGSMDEHKSDMGRISVKGKLAEKRAEISARESHEKEKERKPPTADMER